MCACLAECRLLYNLCSASCICLCVQDCVYVCVCQAVWVHLITDQPLMVILFCETCWVTWYHPALPTDWFGPVSTLAKPFNPVGRVWIVTLYYPLYYKGRLGWGRTAHLTPLPWFKYHCWKHSTPKCSSVAALWPTDQTTVVLGSFQVWMCVKRKERKHCCQWNLSEYECGMSCRSTCDRGVFTMHGYLWICWPKHT